MANLVDISGLIRISEAAKKLKITRQKVYYRVANLGIPVHNIVGIQVIDKKYLVDIKRFKNHSENKFVQV